MVPASYEITREGTTVSVCPLEPVVTSEQMGELIDEVAPHFQEGEAANVVFDMSKVEYLDSSCIAKLFVLLRTTKQHDGRVALAHCQPNVMFLLQMTHLDELFSVFDNIDDALRDLRRLI